VAAKAAHSTHGRSAHLALAVGKRQQKARDVRAPNMRRRQPRQRSQQRNWIIIIFIRKRKKKRKKKKTKKKEK
jgi:hypothetical protein